MSLIKITQNKTKDENQRNVLFPLDNRHFITVFEQLSSKPNHSYDQQVNASFNDEWKYRGLSNYKDYYEQRTSKANKEKKN